MAINKARQLCVLDDVCTVGVAPGACELATGLKEHLQGREKAVIPHAQAHR